MTTLNEQLALTRRQLFGLTAGIGVSSPLLWASRPGDRRRGTRSRGRAGRGSPHFAPKAKRVIYLHMNGGPTQLDTFDYKPKLDQLQTRIARSVRKGQRIRRRSASRASPGALDVQVFAARQVRHVGQRTAAAHREVRRRHRVVKSVHTNAINHDPACTFVMTGSEMPGKPSIGSWLSYGLGSESNDLPAFVVFTPHWPAAPRRRRCFTRMWASGFLPGKYNGVALPRRRRSGAVPVQNPDGVSADAPRPCSTRWAKLNASNFEVRRPGDADPHRASTRWRSACRRACRN